MSYTKQEEEQMKQWAKNGFVPQGKIRMKHNTSGKEGVLSRRKDQFGKTYLIVSLDDGSSIMEPEENFSNILV